MKRIFAIFSLCLIFISTIFVFDINTKAESVDFNQELVDLLTRYYDDGVYIKDTVINLNEKAQNELIKYFHAECNILERTTYYNRDELYMSSAVNDEGHMLYSYYGTEYKDGKASGLTYARTTSHDEKPINAVVAKKGFDNEIGRSANGMELYYITLKDILDFSKENDIWNESNGVYSTTDTTMLDYFREFTAPCFLKPTLENENYLQFETATISVSKGNLVLSLKLVSSGTNSGVLIDSVKESLVFSQAVIRGQSLDELVLSHSSVELNALESMQLMATLNGEDVDAIWSSQNEAVATIDSEGNVFAVGTGTTNVCATVDGIKAECQVTVNAAEGYKFKGVYGSTSNSKWSNGVYTFGKNGVQADLVDLTEQTIELDYYEIELNLILGCAVGTGANFGFQINKTEKEDGSVADSYMLKPMTSANTQLVKNTTSISGLQNIKLEVGKLSKIKICVEKVEAGRNIKAYIDGELYYDYIDTEPLNGTIFGIRCAALSDSNKPHKVSVVSVTKKSYLELEQTSLELNALESKKISANLIGINSNIQWSSEDETVATVDNDGNVFAVGTGETTIYATAEGITSECVVSVKAAEGYKFLGVYGETANSTWNNGVYTVGTGGIQADIVDSNGQKVNLDYFEIELNMILGCGVGTGANFGFQINKTESSNGNVSKCYMFKPTTTDQVAANNLSLVKNGAAISGLTKPTLELKASQLYRVKIVVEKVETGRNVKCYIDGELYINYIDTTPLTGTIFGLRCAALSDANKPHKVSIISIKQLS